MLMASARSQRQLAPARCEGARVLRVAKFLHTYFRRPVGSIREREIHIPVNGVDTPATFVRPYGDAPLPGWVLLHGITVPGRHHTLLRRFARALAATGAAVLIPEVPAWSRLRIDLAAGDATISAATDHLAARRDVDGLLNLVGFSFGATQALTSATLPHVRDRIGSVVAFGGYCDLGATLRFMMTGEHEWEESTRQLEPDPYGRWIAVSNYLRDVPDFAHMKGVVEAATSLAAESGRLGVFAGDPIYDPLKADLRATLPVDQREIWDLIAAPSGSRPSLHVGRDLAERLAGAALARNSAFDPRPRLGKVRGRIILAHGYDDRLIPYTETLRLRRHIPVDADASISITRLFAHSAEASRLGLVEYPAEIARYVTLLRRALTPVDSPPIRLPRRSR